MTMSSRCGDCGLKFPVVAAQGPDHVDESAGEGDQGLGVDLALGSFALVKVLESSSARIENAAR